MNATQLFGVLAAHPYPGAVDLRLNGLGCCFVVGGVEMRYDLDGWVALGRVTPAEWTIPGDFLSDAARVHAEIARVLALVEPADLRAQLSKMTDAHAVVSQRLVGAQKEVAERDATIDELRARVKGSCTTKDGQDPLDPLLSRHNAPVKIGDRTLSPAERAAFVIRRLTRAAQNARAEAAALRAEQEEIAEALGDATFYAEHADGSPVGLNLVERIRARLT